MNKYEEFIQNIISERGQWNPPTKYWEGHHILPKCLGGKGWSTSKHANIIWLTAQEHFIAHKLLVECYPDVEKLSYAFWAMCTVSTTHTIATPEEYEQAKLLRSETLGKKLRTKLIGKSEKDSTRLAHAKAQTGELNGFYGKTHSSATKQKLTESLGKRVRCINTGIEYVSSYEVERQLGINRVLVNNCCRGKQVSTSGGLQFEYVNKDDINFGLPKNSLSKYDRRRQIITLRKILVNLNEAFPEVLSAFDKIKISKLATCESKRYLLRLLKLFDKQSLISEDIKNIIKEL